MVQEIQDPIPLDFHNPADSAANGNGGGLSEEDMIKVTQAALAALRAEPQIMAMIDEHNRRKKASHEGGNSDNYSRRSHMNSSGRKINSDELVDKSTHRSKNDPLQIMVPRQDSGKDLRDKTPPRSEASRKVESGRKSIQDGQGTDRMRKRGPSVSSRKSIVSPRASAIPPAESKEKKHKKDKDKKGKKDKKEKKDKDKHRKSSKVESAQAKDVAA